MATHLIFFVQWALCKEGIMQRTKLVDQTAGVCLYVFFLLRKRAVLSHRPSHNPFASEMNRAPFVCRLVSKVLLVYCFGEKTAL